MTISVKGFKNVIPASYINLLDSVRSHGMVNKMYKSARRTECASAAGVGVGYGSFIYGLLNESVSVGLLGEGGMLAGMHGLRCSTDVERVTRKAYGEILARAKTIKKIRSN